MLLRQVNLTIFALLFVPLVALRSIGGPSAMIDSMQTKGMSRSLIPTEASTGARIAAIISALAWGLGYFGQPHILARFMSARSLVKLHQSAWIAMIWVAVSLTGAVVIGLIAIAMFDGYAHGDQEKVFIDMIGRVIHPWLAGVMLAAILSAIMSTSDSRLLVSGFPPAIGLDRTPGSDHHFRNSHDPGSPSPRYYFRHRGLCLGWIRRGFWTSDSFCPVLPSHNLAIGFVRDDCRDTGFGIMET